MCRLIVIAVVACASPAPPPDVPASIPVREPPPDSADDVVAYAERCKFELGIARPLPAMSCLAGEQIPVTVDGRPLDARLYEQLENGAGCDRPQRLGTSCHNYDLIQRVDVGPDVDAVLLCRQKYWSSPLDKAARAKEVARASDRDRLASFRQYAEFDDLGLILRNRTTGKTCFFTAYNHQLYGGWLPPPDQPALPPRTEVLAAIDAKPPADYPESAWYRSARATYLSPRETAAAECVHCHDLGAFKHSPYVDQLDVVPHNGDLPYLLVGAVFQDSFRQAELREVATEPIDGEPQKCTACHRMTSGGQTCRNFLDWSVGNYPYALSASARRFPAAAWMPLDGTADLHSKARFSRTWGRHIDRMKCCCQKPGAIGCLSRSFGPTAEDLDDFTPGSDTTDSCR